MTTIVKVMGNQHAVEVKTTNLDSDGSTTVMMPKGAGERTFHVHETASLTITQLKDEEVERRETENNKLPEVARDVSGEAAKLGHGLEFGEVHKGDDDQRTHGEHSAVDDEMQPGVKFGHLSEPMRKQQEDDGA